MQFNFNCEEILDCDKNGFAILEGSYKNRIVPGFTLYVNEIIDKMGEASSYAQKLPTIITSAQKFFTSNNRIVFKAEKDKVLGFIKVGIKKLYIRDRDFNYLLHHDFLGILHYNICIIFLLLHPYLFPKMDL